jgi:hypothetical protein
MMNTLRAFGIAAIIAWTWTSSTVFAQGVAADHYGDGVTSYFNGRTRAAEESLSLAIEADSRDPRSYYFRAMCLLRQGRIAEAKGDMMVGAGLEAQQPRRYAIGSALERVQGHDRLLLEKYRRDARTNAVVQTSATAPATASPAPIRTFRERDADVLREERYVPLDELLRPGAPQTVVAEPPRQAAPTPPQATGPAMTAAPVEPPAAQSPATETTNPFADEPAAAGSPESAAPPSETPPAAPPAVTPPQNTEPAAPATPPATPPAESTENPFGS